MQYHVNRAAVSVSGLSKRYNVVENTCDLLLILGSDIVVP